eukprot:scaffold3367_cov106-Isochrysis_galbana.AAC.2
MAEGATEGRQRRPKVPERRMGRGGELRKEHAGLRKAHAVRRKYTPGQAPAPTFGVVAAERDEAVVERLQAGECTAGELGRDEGERVAVGGAQGAPGA